MQPDPPTVSHALVEGESWSFVTGRTTVSGHGPWAVSSSLEVLVTVDGVQRVIQVPDVHTMQLPNPSKGVKGNVMISGVTVVRRKADGDIEQETHRWGRPQENHIEPQQMEGLSGTAHSEFQFFLGWTEMAAQNLMQDGVLAVIFEARQTNTPCASCQKLIGAHLVDLAERSDKLAIFRGSAQQVYESAPGRLGTALHQVKTGARPLDRPGPAHINEVLGVHLTI
ncbi:MAG TPA: hypothetical protein VFM54_19480 [Micromonosporaceae bacterium]|nr:hypothetical protein [Micromonosporaceae bacterium]